MALAALFKQRSWSWLCTILLIGSIAGLSNVATAQSTFQIRSISFPLIGSAYLDDQPGWTPIPTVIQQIKALGANDVKVTVSAGSYNSPTDNLPNAAVNLNPSDSKILSFLQQLKAAGLQVTLFPFANINFDPNGNLLDTVHAQPADFNAWMAARTVVMVRLAQLAQQAGVDRFVVFGDEVQPLTYISANQAGWLNMIAQIRNVFSGSLTSVLYANGTIFQGGNNHIDLTARPIIDALDIIGVGWFPLPLTNTRSPSMAQLLAAWRKNVNGVDTVAFMQGVRAKYSKPVWISDIAFHSFSGDNVSSDDIFNMAVSLTADQQEQANEYDSLLTVLSQNLGSWFLGIGVDSWNRFPPDYTGTSRYLHSAFGENIQGKLAEPVLKQWFSGQRGVGGMQIIGAPAGSSANLTLSASITVSSIDSGKAGKLYVAALLPNNSVYFRTATGWVPFNSTLPPYSNVTLGTHNVPILDGSIDVSGLRGTRIIAGYGVDQNDLLNNSKYLVIYTIQ